jgi:hypothetical protein
MLIHCSPSIVDLAMDGEENLIQIPLVPGLGMVTTQCIGIPLTKLQTPLANCFVGIVNFMVFALMGFPYDGAPPPSQVASSLRKRKSRLSHSYEVDNTFRLHKRLG